ncbi:hypothetical protein [Methylobacterium iners]|uniref:Uncharacterized protein n=1 Tax=Methylobacterium iners TaxID=418707 RepID=A0ABQ4S2Y3_9HYPH|nr:hypothetical protein [Methylobacterium iners]GJD97493.1 hypothetical protein OCOJLMKI_4724 [Methylobacterium iners]
MTTGSIDSNVYKKPTPVAVARLIETHSFEAAAARWHWLDKRTLNSLAQSGRAAAGQAGSIRRPRTYADLDAAVCLEAAYVLGSTTRGERAAGVPPNAGIGIFNARGLPKVGISPAERGIASRIGHGIRAGDPHAIAQRERQTTFELGVGRVLRIALALVHDQPATGRYCLPAPGEALRLALQGEDPAAVTAVFPGFDLAPPVPLPPPTTVPVPVVNEHQEPAVSNAPICARPPHPLRRAPDDATIRADHADRLSLSLATIALNYGISPGSLYAHWKRLGLDARGRLEGYEEAKRNWVKTAAKLKAAEAKASPVEPAQAEPPLPQAPVLVEPQASTPPRTILPTPARLGFEDLVLAARVSMETGVPQAVALTLVAADIARVDAATWPLAPEAIDGAAIDAELIAMVVATEEREDAEKRARDPFRQAAE